MAGTKAAKNDLEEVSMSSNPSKKKRGQKAERKQGKKIEKKLTDQKVKFAESEGSFNESS
jgi:hypothetical protein